jgi:hypothetical protein
MSIIYNIYSNRGKGGAVDYSALLASTPGLSFDPGPLTTPGDYTFAVRACDTTTGLEDANTDARVHVVLDADGNDVTGLPGPPHAVFPSAGPGGSCRVCWAYRPSSHYGIPDGFQVVVARDDGAANSTSTATVPYSQRRVGYSCVLPGPFEYATYAVTVQSFNTVGQETNPPSVTISLGQSEEPLQMDPVTVRLGSVTSR